MTPRRILVDARLPWGSGIGRYVRNIVPRVAAHMAETQFTLLVSPDDVGQATVAVADCANVAITATPIGPFSLTEQIKLPALGREHDLAWFTSYWVPLGWRGRFVVTVHDIMHRDPRFPASPLKRFAAARTFDKVRRDAAHVIFVSRFTRREFEARVGTPRQGSVVHHGIDHVVCDLSVSTGDLPRSRFGLIVSAIKEHKNLAIALEAWERAGLPDWTLVIATPGDALRSSVDLNAQIARMTNVRVLRGITDAELYALYAEAGFVLVPSRYEGFGFPLLEAMRMGAPVVSSTADALVEVAAGALLPFVAAADREGWEQAIRRMGECCGPSDGWQTQVDRHNLEVASRYTWDRAAGQTAGILASVLQNGKGDA